MAHKFKPLGLSFTAELTRNQGPDSEGPSHKPKKSMSATKDLVSQTPSQGMRQGKATSRRNQHPLTRTQASMAAGQATGPRSGSQCPPMGTQPGHTKSLKNRSLWLPRTLASQTISQRDRSWCLRSQLSSDKDAGRSKHKPEKSASADKK